MPDDLVEWLRGVLDERERLARAAIEASGGQHWRAADSGIYPEDNPSHHPGPFLADAYGHTDLGYGRHIAEHDPASVLRQVEATRRIIDLHDIKRELTESEGESYTLTWCATCNEPGWCPTLRLLALPYAGQPGWREEWRP